MSKSELIKSLEQFDDDAIVIIGDSQEGWSNVGEVKLDGCQISIMQDMERPFSSE